MKDIIIIYYFQLFTLCLLMGFKIITVDTYVIAVTICFSVFLLRKDKS